MRTLLVVVSVALVTFLLPACKRPGGHGPDSRATLHGDASRGEILIAQFECTRCHAIEKVAAPAKDKQCVGCHHDIDTGSVEATPAQKARWQAKVAELGDAPTLVAVGARLRRPWIQAFLTRPSDLRPLLQPTMPRLALSEQQAADIAAFLAPAEVGEAEAVETSLPGADPTRGREVMTAKGCALCHRMTGGEPLVGALLPVGVTVKDLPGAIRLAPDLRFARDRWGARSLVRWLKDPPAVKPDTLMPSFGLSDAEAKSVAAYLLTAPLQPIEKRVAPPRLAVLERKVTYDEVATRVLRKTCWHCHGEPDFERGDGGPGNSGGFGFKGRGLNLSDYASTFAGYLDDRGKRTSVFAPMRDGTPYVVAALLARQNEEAGRDGELRGMPLGLPALAPEDVQLVETWIAQGRAR